MSQNLQPVRGTHDWLPNEAAEYHYVIEQAFDIARRFGFGRIEVPVFEFSEVFHRTLGETSDVVAKETYTFTDRGGESLTLRPEFTAGIARAFISNKLQDHTPCRYFYAGPAFRYERPQKGRMRQLHQLGVELIGSPEPQADVDTIVMAMMILEALGLKESVTLEVNSLGDVESRQKYRQVLVEYFNDHCSKLSEDSRTRLEKNPLRILDSKDAGDKAIVANAPSLHEHFNDQSREFFGQLMTQLEALDLSPKHNLNLVRGLDYYSHTVFEVTTSQLGAQGTVLAGGRYDGLIGMMGGAATPGVGWAAGIERLCMLREAANVPKSQAISPIAVVPVGEEAEAPAFLLAQQLREAGFVIEYSYRGNTGKRMKRADKVGAKLAILLGADELANGRVMVKNLASGEQRAIPRDQLQQELAK